MATKLERKSIRTHTATIGRGNEPQPAPPPRDHFPTLDVMIYDMYLEWCRLHTFPKPAETTLDSLIDEATGVTRTQMVMFVQWFTEDCLARLNPE